MIDLLNDLDVLKLDFIIIDEIYFNLYSKIIENKFYIRRNVKRTVSFDVLLRGFSREQTSCFQSVAPLHTQKWIKSLLDFGFFKV